MPVILKVKEKNMLEGKKQRVIKIIIFLSIIAVIAYFVLPVSVPLIIAFLVAAIFEPIIRWGSRKLSIARRYMVLIVFALFLSALVVLLYFIISKGISQFIYLAERIPQYTVTFMNQMEEWNNAILLALEDLSVPVVTEIEYQLARMLEKGLEPLRNFDYLGLVASIGTWLPSFLINILVFLIALFLFMIEMPNIIKTTFSYMKDSTEEKIKYMTSRLLEVFVGFFKAQFLVSLIIFAVSLIGLLIMSPKLAFVMSLIIWLIDLIPIIGSIIIVGPWALIEFIQGEDRKSVV